MTVENGDAPLLDLPDGWSLKALAEIGRYHNGRAFKKEEWRDNGRPIIRIQNLTDPTKPFNFFQGEADERHTVRAGDILVSWAATLDAFRWHGQEAVLNQHIFKVESFISPAFHYWAIKAVLERLRSQTHGTGMVHITRDKFLGTKVAIPSQAEQERIVERIEALFRESHEAEAAVMAARNRVTALRRAVLAHAMTGRL